MVMVHADLDRPFALPPELERDLARWIGRFMGSAVIVRASLAA